ncbi:MAG TPA: uroporphyrinogen decarboxylase family protein [Anaerolineales bacterium]
MNGRERIALTMRHQEPDRVPVMCQLSLGHYLLNTGIPPEEMWYTGEAMAEAMVRLQRRYRFDGILVNVPGRPQGYLKDAVRFDKAQDGLTVTWRDGGRTVMPWDDNAHFYQADESKPERADFETLDPDHLENIDDFPGYIWNTYHIQSLPGKVDRGVLKEIPDYFLDTLKLVKAKAGPEVSIHAEVFSPFTHFMELFGYQNALLALMSDPVKANAILDRLTEATIAWALAQAGEGVDAILISSAFAGAPFLSRRMYKEFVVPCEHRLTQAIKDSGNIVYTHTCGRIGDRLDLMEETGTQGIDTLDPPPLGNGDLAVAKRDFGQRLFFKGNLNSVEILNYKTEEEVLAEATNRIEIGKPGAGYILSTACSVAPRVEPWKLELLTPLAEKIGQYR